MAIGAQTSFDRFERRREALDLRRAENSRESGTNASSTTDGRRSVVTGSRRDHDGMASGDQFGNLLAGCIPDLLGKKILHELRDFDLGTN
jgi:hypothetical protein